MSLPYYPEEEIRAGIAPAPQQPATAERVATAIAVVYGGLRDQGRHHEEARAGALRAYGRFDDPPLLFEPTLAAVAYGYDASRLQHALATILARAGQYHRARRAAGVPPDRTQMAMVKAMLQDTLATLEENPT